MQMTVLDGGFYNNSNENQEKSNDNFTTFDDITSKMLLEMKEPIEIMLAVGADFDKVITLNFELLAPSKSDLKWAEKLHKKTQRKRHAEVKKVIDNNELWRMAYIVKLYQEKDYNKYWIEPNNVFASIKENVSMLAHTVAEGKKEMVGLFLQTKDVDINQHFWVDSYDGRYALDFLLDRSKDIEEVPDILNMLVASGLEVSNRHISKAKTNTVKEILKVAYDEQIAKDKEEQLEDKTTSDIVKKDEVEYNKDENESKNVGHWTKLDDNTICKIVSDGKGFRLRKIFNFNSSNITEIGEYLNAEGAVITATQPTVRAMSTEPSKAEIKEAQAKLRLKNNTTNNVKSDTEEATGDKPTSPAKGLIGKHGC